MDTRSPQQQGVSGPAGVVPVAMLGRTSTLDLQDPYASMNRQITSATEWLPDGFYLAAYYWDVESGGLDLDQRGHGTAYQQFTAKGLPRDGGLADLIAEAKSPQPRFAAVVCEDIERSARDSFSAIRLERELQNEGILLFAADEPLDLERVNPTTILLRRTKQNFAEYFRLQLKDKIWKGLREHAAEGWNIGKVPAGYLAEKVRHPVPSKASQGRTKTRLVLDPARAPVIAAIYGWRAWDHLGVPTILARLNADPGRYPSEDPQSGWSVGGVYAILRNPKYTGYQVFGRTRNGKPVPPEKWYWSDQPTHPAIIDRATWDAAQAAGAAHLSARDTSPHNPANWRTYPLRSRIRCKICHRRMCGITHTHPHNKSRTEYAYYQCSFTPNNARHAAAHPDHPSTVAAREDLLLGQLYQGLSAYALGPGRAQRLAQLIPAEATAQQALTDARAKGMRTRLKQISVSQDSLILELATLPTDPADAAAMAMRARIRAHYGDLHDEHEKLTRQLAALTQQAPPAQDPALIDLLPELAGSLASLPPPFRPGSSPRSTFRSCGTPA